MKQKTEIFFRGLNDDISVEITNEEMLQYLLDNPSVEYLDHIFLGRNDDDISDDDILEEIRDKPYSLCSDKSRWRWIEAEGVNATSTVEDAKYFCGLNATVVEFEGEPIGVNLYGDGWVVRPVKVLKIYYSTN
jgi:hypothetical protein